MALTVAVTGPTGEIGTSVVRALEQERRVDRVLGMARRPFDPASRGWRKTEYRQGDVLDRAAVAAFVAEADVVVHLAYVIVGSREESQRINLAGTRNVFEATVSADRPRRLVYTSSLAAYGYHVDNPVPLNEDVPARGSPEHYYSAQKASLPSCRDGVGAHRAAPDAQGYDEGPPRARLGAGAHRSRDPDRHGRRRAGQGRLVSAMPHRVPCLADGARRDVRVA